MKNMKKILISLLACLLCFSMLVACGGDQPNDTTASTDTTDTTATTGGGDEPVDPNRVLKLVENSETPYRIIVSKNAKNYEWDAAYKVRLMVLTITGTTISIYEDDAVEPQEHEIVIGSETNRKSLYTVPQEYGDGYCVFTSGERLIIEARSGMGMSRGVAKFGKDCFNVNIALEDFYKGEEKSELTVLASYVKAEVFNASSFYIVHDDTIINKRIAYAWITSLESVSGAKYIVEGDMGSLAPTNTDEVIIKIVEDGTIANGEWKLHKKGEADYEVHAADYYGFHAASVYFRKYIVESRKEGSGMPLYPDSTMGSFRDEGILKRAEESALYAFEHTSDIRVMFNNVLFYDPMPAQRDLYNAEFAAIYMPDVYGLQEVNYGRRGSRADGTGGVIAELAKLGYVETLDSRVRNAYSTNETIPGTDAGPTLGDEYAGQLRPGYGTGGAMKVTVGEETFFTYYNHTPLLYNPDTTIYIDGGYYWYKNQWDQRPGQNHENGSSDCGSKSATWGLFQDIETGAQYIVISTHMCTRSDYVRGLQGAEMVELINSLIDQYNVPVMLGGDYNGRITSQNYIKFVEGGLVNVQRDKLASIYTSPATSHHSPYPEYNGDYKLVVPGIGDTSGATNVDNNIDHIMVKNHDTMDITVYGVVIDTMSITNADHFPIFMDFSIKTVQSE